MTIRADPAPAVALDCRNNLGESIVWDDRASCLWWVNIHHGEVWRWDPDRGVEPQVIKLNQRVGAVALRERGGLVVALEKGFATLDPLTGIVDMIASIAKDLSTTRLNDGRIDPAGRFVCGGMEEGQPQRHLSSVYSLDGNGNVGIILSGIACSNSICWSPDGSHLYFTDMPTRRIDVFDYEVLTGAITNRRTFADLTGEPGFADGSIVDAEGYLWNAQWGGYKLVRYAPNGLVDREIELPVAYPTCLTFGGTDLDTLYVTSAWFSLTKEARAKQPLAGSLFTLKPGVRGQPENRFSG
jgi:L-arabinonolactonase